MDLTIVAASSHAALTRIWPHFTAQLGLRDPCAFIIDGSLSAPLVDLIAPDSIVQSIAAGCVCCLGGPVVKTTLARLIREHRPSQCVLIGGAQAALSGMADATDSPMLTPHLQLKALVWAGGSATSAEWVAQQRESATHDFSDLHAGPFDSPSVQPNDVLNQTTWPRQICFDRQRLQTELAAISAPEATLLDVKTARAWYRADRLHGQWHWRESHWRLHSRLTLPALAQGAALSRQLATLRNAIEDCQVVDGA